MSHHPYVFFYGNKTPGKGFLSQWYECKFVDDEDPTITYKSAEQYMMYQKALLFGDKKAAREILVVGANPRVVKAIGRRIKNFDESVWKANREIIVYNGNFLKFTQNKKLKEKLLLLYGCKPDTIFVEASPTDRIWGIGYIEGPDALQNISSWGLNLLGLTLTSLSEDLYQNDKLQE